MLQVSRTQASRTTRSLVALGAAAVALAITASSASAFSGGFGGFHGGYGGFGGYGGGHGGGFQHGGGMGGMTHLPSYGGRFGGFRGPVSYHPPIYHPPIYHPPRFPIGHGPIWHHPVWPPVVINHYPRRWPIIPVGGPVYVPTPVVVGGGVARVPVVSAPVAVAAAPVCGPTGSYVTVTFLPTATVADVDTFLKTYNVSMSDGPSADGTYRLRLSDTPMPTDRITEVVTSMRSQAAIVSNVQG